MKPLGFLGMEKILNILSQRFYILVLNTTVNRVFEALPPLFKKDVI